MSFRCDKPQISPLYPRSYTSHPLFRHLRNLQHFSYLTNQHNQHQQQQQQTMSSASSPAPPPPPSSMAGGVSSQQQQRTSSTSGGGAQHHHHAGQQQHYSLKWNNHQSHVLSAFDALLQNESLVDCTLVCDDTNIKAHKVVLSACSPYFQKIFMDNPCKHPIIVLKDVKGWEVQCIVDFMYKGETSVPEAQLQNLIRAAEGLRVRGLTSGSSESYTVEETRTPFHHHNSFMGSPPTAAPAHRYHHPHPEEHRLHHHSSPMSLSHSHGEERPRSPVAGSGPRRKQARPRRRSGDSIGNSSLDLSKAESPNSMHGPGNGFSAHKSPNVHDDLIPENLSLKRPSSSPAINLVKMESLLEDVHHRGHATPTPSSAINDGEATSSDDIMDRKPSPASSMGQHHMDSRPHFPHPVLGDHEANARVEALQALNFMAAGGGLPPFPHGHHGLPLPPHTSHIPTPASLAGLTAAAAAATMARPTSTPVTPSNYASNPHRKGQHSAPRGGPPRSWTNEDLTKALENVWNKRMTTSQASRVFGIPYNSLLMYVRGKYGKSLKLDRLKQRTPAANDNLNTIGNSRTTPKEKLHHQEKMKMSPSRKRLGLDNRASELPNFGLSPATLAAAAARVSSPSTGGAFSPYTASGLLLPGLQEQIGLLRMLPSHDSSRVRDLMFNMHRDQANSLINNTPPRESEPKTDEATSPTLPTSTTLFALQQAAAAATAASADEGTGSEKPAGTGSLGSTHSPQSSSQDEDLEAADEKNHSEEALVMDDDEEVGEDEEEEEVASNPDEDMPPPSASEDKSMEGQRPEISAV